MLRQAPRLTGIHWTVGGPRPGEVVPTAVDNADDFCIDDAAGFVRNAMLLRVALLAPR